MLEVVSFWSCCDVFKGSHGKWFYLVFYPLLLVLACYGSDMTNFLCIERKVPHATAFRFTPFQIFCCCVEVGGVMEVESIEDIKLTE